MKKSAKALLLAGFMVMTASTTVWAAGWQKDPAGWRYQKEDGNFLKDGWKWVDGKCYYFTASGVCLIDTTTPDGYTVDKDGAWVVDGVVQTQKTGGQGQASGTQGTGLAAGTQGAVQALGAQGSGQAQGTGQTAAGVGVANLVVGTQDSGVPFAVSGLVFTTPAGFGKEASSTGDRLYFYNAARTGAIVVRSEALPVAAQDAAYVDAHSEEVLDGAMARIGTPAAKMAKPFTSGTWYFYQYDKAQQLGLEGGSYVYARISGGRLQMITFAGDMNGSSPDQIMMDCVR